MVRSSTAQTMRPTGPATAPQIGCGVRAVEQLALGLTVEKSIPQRVADVVDAIGKGVDAMGGTVAFAAHLERPVSEVSRRTRREDDGKGSRMEPFAIYFALFDDAAFEAAVSHMLVARGYKPAERVRQATPEEKLRAVAASLSDRAKRAIEREQGWPAGSLDA